jgi:uncharacterized protein YndB with AHSA1/START domain
MARNTAHFPVDPQQVWAVLEDPYAYPKWVVGADKTLEADASWPAPGSKFEVQLAGGAQDHTEVESVDPGRRIVLLAARRMYGPARVTIELSPANGGTDVTMVEDPAGKLAPLRFVPPVHLAIRLRNKESLDRLRKLAER